MTNEIKNAVNNFFNGNETVFANQKGANYDSNFYGDTEICELTQGDVIFCIEETINSGDLVIDEAIESILGDMQLDRPVTND